jgi:hypoxanthine phosphoribosyltransferase
MNNSVTVGLTRPDTLPHGSQLVIPHDEIQRALDGLAREITADLAERRPLAVTVMQGGLVFAGQLLPRLRFALDCDFIHARRYGNETHGGELEWLTGPHEDVAGRTVLLLDDILDEGRTLAALRGALLARGAEAVFVAAFARKERGVPPVIEADYVGVTVPDLFVFGFGMDAAGAWRNLPAIYALPLDGGGAEDDT